jgi:hypothetical protein
MAPTQIALQIARLVIKHRTDNGKERVTDTDIDGVLTEVTALVPLADGAIAEARAELISRFVNAEEAPPNVATARAPVGDNPTYITHRVNKSS